MLIKMNRLIKTTAAGLAAMVIMTGCAAPAAQTSETAQPSASSQQPAVQPKNDTLVVGTTTQIESVSRADYYFDVLSGTLLQMAPVSIDEKGVFHPMLTDFESADAKTWTLTVLEGMKWQDGVPVTAQDIKFTLEYLDSQEKDKYLARYESVEVLDDRQLRLVLKTPDINMLNNLTTLRVIPMHIYKDIEKLADADEKQSTLGCGAYKFVSFDSDAGTLTFEADRSFGDGSQRMEKVIFKLYGNADTMLMALKKGDIDMIYSYAGGIEPAAATELQGAGRAITTAPLKDTSNPAVLVFNNSTEPWSDLNLRKAVWKALDYDKFRELFGSQYSVPARAGFVPEGSAGYIETEQNTRNLEAAKAALALAGASDSDGDGFVELGGKPLTLELLLRSDKPVYARYGELVQANLAEVGIKVELKPMDVAQFRTITEQEHTNQAMISRFTAFGMGMGAGMGSSYLDARLTSNGQGQVNDTAYAALVDRMKTSATREQFEASSADCQRYYAEQLPAIALYWDSYIQAYDAGLGDFTVDGTFGLLNMQTWFTITR